MQRSSYFSTKNKAIQKNFTQIVSLNIITYTNWLTGEQVLVEDTKVLRSNYTSLHKKHWGLLRRTTNNYQFCQQQHKQQPNCSYQVMPCGSLILLCLYTENYNDMQRIICSTLLALCLQVIIDRECLIKKSQLPVMFQKQKNSCLMDNFRLESRMMLKLDQQVLYNTRNHIRAKKMILKISAI